MSRLLEQALRESGFEVGIAEDGQAGLQMAPDYDALLVDVMLPVMNGFDMVRQLREQGCRVPVLFLTAKGALPDMVKGFDLGGDDYLVKPFRLEELLVRLRALLRRTRQSQDVIVFEDLWMDTRTRRARRGDQWLFLSKTEFAILEMLMLRPETVISKQAILNEVWNQETFRDDNVVEVYINYLRGKLESLGRTRLIHTVRGHGYVLRAHAA